MTNINVLLPKRGLLRASGCLPVLLMLAVGLQAIHAQALSIELSWNADSCDGFEGGLVMPRTRGAEEDVLRSLLPGRSRDGLVQVQASQLAAKALWSADTLRPGWYQFHSFAGGDRRRETKPGIRSARFDSVRFDYYSGVYV